MLRVEELVTGYGKKQVVSGVSLEVRRGEIVAVIGHNGAGKSTLLKAVFGVLPIWEGRLFVNDEEVEKPDPRALLSKGMAYVPQGNRVFSNLTVRENLEMGGITLSGRAQVTAGVERALTLFPALEGKMKQRAGTLSGGEKQMLALANALILSPAALLLDEPSLGLAPLLIADALGRVKDISRRFNVTVLIVEQKISEVLKIADRVCVLRNGRVSFTGAAEDLREERKLREVYI